MQLHETQEVTQGKDIVNAASVEHFWMNRLKMWSFFIDEFKPWN